MLRNQEPDWNIADPTDAEVYDAIRYLESGARTGQKLDAGDQDKDNGIAICVCLYVALSVCVAFVWFYWR